MKSDLLKEIMKQLRLRLRGRPKPELPEPPMPIWEDIDPDGEAARESLLRGIEEDIKEQQEALTEALRSKN